MRPTNILIVMNPFKHNLKSLEVGTLISEGIREFAPNIHTTVLPASDGGDGFLDALKWVYALDQIYLPTISAVGNPLSVPVLLDKSKLTAYIETSLCNGLRQCSRVDFIHSSSHGIGLLIKQVVRMGYRDIHIGVGGSASTDLGLGLLQALGLEIKDKKGELFEVNTGNIGHIASFSYQSSSLLADMKDVSLNCWVDGDAYVDGDDGCWQRTINKGGTASDAVNLKSAVLSVLPLMEKAAGRVIAGRTLLGCGGGVPAGLAAFLDTKVLLGSQRILELIGFEQAMEIADLVITGEGVVDDTTFLNKLPGRVAELAIKSSKPCIFIASRSTLPFSDLREKGVYAMLRSELDDYQLEYIHANNMNRNLLRDCGKNLAALIVQQK